MKYSERFFKFPIRIYDRFSMEKAEEEEKSFSGPVEGDWTQGTVKIPHTEIVGWGDYYDSIQGVEGVDKDGFSSCIIMTETMGAYVCTIPKKKFEELLDNYTEKYELWAEKLEAQKMEQLQKTFGEQG